MNGLSIEGEPAPESGPKEGVPPSFDTLMEELAGKIQGEGQTVRQFAGQIEAAVIRIHQQYPEQMSESCMVQVERTQFFHGLRRTYKETFRHLYEDEEASKQKILQAAITMEEALNNLGRIPRDQPLRRHQEGRRPRATSPKKKNNIWGWARTGLEPTVIVHVNNEPVEAILDLGSGISVIDIEIVEDLNKKLTPFVKDMPQCVSIEEGKLTNSVLNIIGWIEIELGILGVGLIQTGLWVTDNLISKGVPIVLGSHQIKQILAQANTQRMDCWQQPWKSVYQWYCHYCEEELSSSEVSFEMLPSPDVALEGLRVSTPPWEEEEEKVKQSIAKSGSTALKGIPGPLEEPDGQEDSAPAAMMVYPLPRLVEEYTLKGGDEKSVFANLAEESDGSAAEVGIPTCNSKEEAPAASTPAGLPSFPSVSCKITPTGETVFSLQWDNK